METEGGLSLGWFRKNEIVVNSGKFQAIIINRKEVQAKHKLIIDKEIKTINLKKTVKLLGINIGMNKLLGMNIFQYCVLNRLQ